MNEHIMSTVTVAGTARSFSGARSLSGARSAGVPAARTGATGLGTPRLRMTDRGRGLLTFLVAAPLVFGALAFSLNGGQATATLEGSDVPFTYITVASGETMWQLAGALAPQADPRDVIDQIVQLNQLSSADVFAGQELAIPAQYSVR